MTSYLIKGQTTGRRYEEGGTVLVVRIQHVYLGAREIQGASFEVTVYQRGGHGALVLNETPSVGEEGLWLVRVDEKEKKVEADVVAMQKGCDVVSLPVFATDSLRYRSVEMWAEDVHKVAAVPRDDQIGYVRQLCLATDNYATRAWCVSFIGEHGAEDDLTYLRGLVSQGQVPVRAQLAIDEVLCLRKGKVWYGNKERSVLLERWVSVPLDKQTESRLLTRIDVSSQRGEITEDQLEGLRKAIKSNPHMSSAARKRIERVKSRTPVQSKIEEENTNSE